MNDEDAEGYAPFNELRSAKSVVGVAHFNELTSLPSQRCQRSLQRDKNEVQVAFI